MRLPSRMGTMILRSTTAMDSSSASVALRAAITCGVTWPRPCAAATAAVRRESAITRLRIIGLSLPDVLPVDFRDVGERDEEIERLHFGARDVLQYLKRQLVDAAGCDVARTGVATDS